MGQEISQTHFTAEDHREFLVRLAEETSSLASAIEHNRLEHNPGICGLELEAWLLDSDWQPAAANEVFLSSLNDPLVVPELSLFNFEINSIPEIPQPRMFTRIHRQLDRLWQACEQHAALHGLIPLQIGIPPTLRDDVLTLDNISALNRYHALNRQVLASRKGSPLRIDILGAKDHLQLEHYDVMTEAATTSLQIHLQLDSARALRFYNAAQILAAPMVAVCANSPYLFGRELWEETRIPLFEQSVSTPAFFDQPGHVVERVTLGTGYLKESVIELFRENQHAFPVLLPLHYDCSDKFEHLRLHNSTIWRWNRLLIDFNEHGLPTMRLEHRVAPAGPSTPDVVANIALFYGLVHHLAALDPAPEQLLPFEHARANFYECARLGLEATVFWLDGHEYPIRQLLTKELLPAASRALDILGIDNHDNQYYLGEVIGGRLRNGQTGAVWQRRFVARHGPDFKQLTEAYYQQQRRQQPVYQWTT